MPTFKDIDLKFVENEFKHAIITSIQHSEAHDNQIDVIFNHSHLKCNITFDNSNKRITFYFGFSMVLPMQITDDDVQHRIESYIARKLSKLISIPQYNHRYNINTDMLHRFLSWGESNDYHKVFKIKTLTKFKDFKYILKHWLDFEQYFRINLWSRQCLLSFIASRNKWYLIMGEHEWIIKDTPTFWLHSFHVYSIEDGKRKLNTYYATYGTKQNTWEVVKSMHYHIPGILNVSSSINSLKPNFIQQFDIRFSKKSKWITIGIHHILKQINSDTYVRQMLINNYIPICNGLSLNLNEHINSPSIQLDILKNIQPLYNKCRKYLSEEYDDSLCNIVSHIEQCKLLIN